MESNAAGLSFLPAGLRKIANKRVKGKSSASKDGQDWHILASSPGHKEDKALNLRAMIFNRHVAYSLKKHNIIYKDGSTAICNPVNVSTPR